MRYLKLYEEIDFDENDFDWMDEEEPIKFEVGDKVIINGNISGYSFENKNGTIVKITKGILIRGDTCFRDMKHGNEEDCKNYEGLIYYIDSIELWVTPWNMTLITNESIDFDDFDWEEDELEKGYVVFPHPNDNHGFFCKLENGKMYSMYRDNGKLKFSDREFPCKKEILSRHWTGEEIIYNIRDKVTLGRSKLSDIIKELGISENEVEII